MTNLSDEQIKKYENIPKELLEKIYNSIQEVEEEKYYKLGINLGSEWEYFCFKTKGNLQMKDLSRYSNIKFSKLEEINKKEYERKIRDFEHDSSYG